MKHLPNLLTLCNLFAGCLAIVYVLNAQPYWTEVSNGQTYWIFTDSQPYLGSLLIFAAAVFDMLDGLCARWLNVFSPIGKDLDSLADVVSFGVAPALIVYKMLWAAYMSQPNALDISMLAMAPAILIACFAALRLARFNIIAEKGATFFIGMPTPAVGLFVASLPLINWFNPHGLGNLLQGPWSLYAIVGILCWLMVSRLHFFKLMPVAFSFTSAWRQILLVVIAVVSIIFLGVAGISTVFVAYILLSLIGSQSPDMETLESTKTEI